MRKMFVVAATFVITLAGLSLAQAGDRPQPSGGYASSGSTSGNSSRTYRYYRGGAFDRLLELERRKNAWLFGGFRR
ncbi:MAG: hypothetical protein AB7U20_06850 [Planctomycetaceae bacterium]